MPDRRGALQEHLRKHDIGMAIHYPIPIHLQPAAKTLGHKGGDFPVVERHADRILSLRHHQELTEESRSAMLRTRSTTSTARERQIRGES
jgi:dTDP-4-amino-4,6-dideoxygalactose transaminase